MLEELFGFGCFLGVFWWLFWGGGGKLFLCLFSFVGFFHCYGTETINIRKHTEIITEITPVAVELSQCSACPSNKPSAKIPSNSLKRLFHKS